MSRTVTITDEDSIVIEQFIVSNRDAEKIVDDYSTNWMESGELKEYLIEGE